MKGRDRCFVFLLWMLLDVGTVVYGFLLSGVNGHSGTDGTIEIDGRRNSCANYHLDNFIDRSCFMVHTPQGEMVRACPAGTLFSTSQCGCTRQMEHNHHYLPACWKAHHQGGYMTNVSPQPTGHNTGNTQAGANTTTQLQHYHSNCEHYQSYQHIMNLIKSDNCLSANTDTYGKYTTTPHGCQCSSPTHGLTIESVPHGQYQSCKYDSSYMSIIHNILGHDINHSTSLGVCETHHSLWKMFSHVTHSHNCQSDLIKHIALSLQHQGDPCQCRQTEVHTTSINIESTTNHPTTATFEGNNCNKLQTILVLANHSAVTFSQSGQCPDGTRAKPEAIAMSLCGTHNLTTWHPGLNVLQHCDSLPTYIAVASFFNGVYPKDGIAGVLVHCNDTAITILTQECGHGAQLVHFNKDVYARAVEMPQSYFTISQLDVNKPIFG